MNIVDCGHGSPVVLIPSLQGRWEYLQRAVKALSATHRVVTFSLGDERVWGLSARSVRTLDDFVHHVVGVLDDRGLSRAALCGFSFGGRVALRLAAKHPEYASALVLVSTPGPGWHLKPAHRTYAKHPVVLGPAFFASAPLRVRAELASAFPDRRERWRFAFEQVATFLRAPLSPSLMAARARLIDGADITSDCARITVPTLVINGEPHLDHVVPVGSTSAFARAIPHACSVTLSCSGHFGCITQAGAFAAEVDRFLQRAHSRSTSDAA